MKRAPSPPPEIEAWFARRGWRVRLHQREMLEAADSSQHALLVADAGAGKTFAGFMPTLADFTLSRRDGEISFEGLHTVYVSPLKAFAHDVQRNLMAPIEEIGLDIRVETHIGDAASDWKARHCAHPAHVLLTTPEALSLLLSYPEASQRFAMLKRVVIDEMHAFAMSKRGDLLALCLARLQAIAPQMRRAALSATVDDPDRLRAWLAPWGDIDAVKLVEGERGAEPDLSILLPDDGRVPWSSQGAAWAIPRLYQEIRHHRTTLVFANTRLLAECLFGQLVSANEDKLLIGIHHGSLSKGARRKVEAAMARGELRALVCTGSPDLGIDWGDIDLVVQMGAPKGSSRLRQRIGCTNHRLDQSSKMLLVPGDRFEFLESVAASDAVHERRCDGEDIRTGGLDVLARHVMACACAGPFSERELLAEVSSSLPYAALSADRFTRVLDFVANGGHAVRGHDRFHHIVRARDGTWHLTHPDQDHRHRMSAGIIVESEMFAVRFRNGRPFGHVAETFGAGLKPNDTFRFAGMDLEVERVQDLELIVHQATKKGVIPGYSGSRMPLSPQLGERVLAMVADRSGWGRFPDDVREWLEMQDGHSHLPAPGQLLVESFPHNGLQFTTYYTFGGWHANQSLGMLITRRMKDRDLDPMGFFANDYALAVWGLMPVDDPEALLSPDILTHEFIDWAQQSSLLQHAFHKVAVISGLVERQHPGKHMSDRPVTSSTEFIFEILRKYEPDHLLMQAAWADVRDRMTDIARVAEVLDCAAEEVDHVKLDRISPFSVPLLTVVGREMLRGDLTDDMLLVEEEALAAAAMRTDNLESPDK